MKTYSHQFFLNFNIIIILIGLTRSVHCIEIKANTLYTVDVNFTLCKVTTTISAHCTCSDNYMQCPLYMQCLTVHAVTTVHTVTTVNAQL